MFVTFSVNLGKTLLSSPLKSRVVVQVSFLTSLPTIVGIYIAQCDIDESC